jgi:acetyl esterase
MNLDLSRPHPVLRLARDAAFRRLMSLPSSVLRRMAGPPVVVDGQTLDVRVQIMLDASRRMGIRQPEAVEEARRRMEEDASTVAIAPPSMKKEQDVSIPGPGGTMKARVYTPRTAGSSPGLLVFLHGGGFVTGSIASHEPALKELAHDSGVVVVSVDYRLGPEHRFPAAADDALAAWSWAKEHAAALGCDPERVGIGGDSAGGNLSAVACHLARDRGGPVPAAQLLIYPAIDWSRSSASHRTFATGYFLEEEYTFWYERHYLNRVEERDDPRASPIRFPRFDGLPRALVVTAGFDVLRDEGRTYAEALENAGVKVDFCCETSLIHGFLNIGIVDAARAANRRIARRLGQWLA